ncbi:PSD1 and planctomycete cytochrome C domain-containing protein [Tundrisphaera lichenicola]|uniref:PSD1 and planctomycete cytochrome C domain-containing protein n=1 Tax=Tundrisphaera lichenicola TaxID=2029860 RepID=UPI003EBD426B
MLMIPGLLRLALILGPIGVEARAEDGAASSPPAKLVVFDRDVLPIFQERCLECHGAAKRKGELRLDSLAAIRAGGISGDLLRGNPGEASLLIRHVSGQGDAARMPPKGDPLSESQIGLLNRWVEQQSSTGPEGLPVPNPPKPVSWAFLPSVRPPIPEVPEQDRSKIRNPIDSFVLEKLRAKGMHPSEEADRRILIRRVSVDLTGIAPTPDEIKQFVEDPSTEAYESLVDRLLASPRYGERWARHWLDVVHYADSHGQDQDRPRPNAWPYRDYIILSLNEDKSYDRFVMEQVAGDVLFPGDPAAIMATGFLAAGPWDESGLMGISEDSIDRLIAHYLDRDDMVTTTMSTFTGLTVGCARCHDHKFDPISQEDYYSLQAVFAGVDKAERAFDPDPAVSRRRVDLEKLLERVRSWKGQSEPTLLDDDRQAESIRFEAEVRAHEAPWVAPSILELSSRDGSILKPLRDGSILSLGQRPEKDTYTIRLGSDLNGITGLRLELLSDETLPKHGPGRNENGNLHLSEIRVKARARRAASPEVRLNIQAARSDFDQEGWGVLRAIDADDSTAWGIFPAVGESHEAVFSFQAPIDFEGGTELIVELDQTHGGGHLIGRFRITVTCSTKPLENLPGLPPEDIRDLMAIPVSWRSDAQRAELSRRVWERRLESEYAALPEPSRVYCATNRFTPEGSFRPAKTPRPVHVLKRGEVNQPGEQAIPGSIKAIGSLPSRFNDLDPNDEGRRRAALARWLTDPANPLSGRVIVNRVWHYHFGKGIVDTPNDFGKMGGMPSHPELLDWLVAEFRQGGGSLKSLHRLIVTSATYRQVSRHDPEEASIDSENRLLWCMNRSRLDAETVRDTILQASGRLVEKRYGPPVMHFRMSPGVHVTPVADYEQFDLDLPQSRRRSIYRYIFRTRPDPFLESLDCPDASQSAPVRAGSVGALQALALWNNKFTLRHSEHVAERASRETTDLGSQVRSIALLILGREPTDTEQSEWMSYARRYDPTNLARILFNSSEFLFVD